MLKKALEAITALSELISYIDAKNDYHSIQTDKIIKVNFNKNDTNTDNEDSKIMKYDRVTLKKRADGRWEYSKLINGERLSFYGRTQKECIDKYKSFMGKDIKELCPIFDLIKEYYNKTTGNAYEEHETVSRLHIFPNMINRDVRNIREDDIIKLLNKIGSPRNNKRLIPCYSTLSSWHVKSG